MPVSPQDFSLWARATGNKYPSSLEEKARLAPEVHSFMRNFGKQGELGEQKEEKSSSTLENIGKAALVAGGIAAGVAAARDPRVQTAVKDFGSAAAQQASNVRENVQSFLSGLGTKRTADPDIVRNSGDVTPGPIAQQSGGQTISDPWQEPTVPMPQNRDLAGEATALASALEQIRSSKGQLGEPSRQQVYESVAQKYIDPGVGKDVEFKPSHAGISSGKESLATDPSTGERYRVGGGPSLTEQTGLGNAEPLAPQSDLPPRSAWPRSQGQIIGELGGINGDVQYVAPEATTDTTNSLFSAPITPDNRVPKAETFNPNSLTGQQNIQEAADNINDIRAEQNILSRSEKFLTSQAAADPTAGQIQIDPQLNLFGPREPRATIGGRPYRYTQLEQGPAQRFGEIDPTGEQLSNIRGLGTQTVLDTGGINISEFSSDPKTRTAQQQALNIFQATGDPSFLKSTFGVEGPSMPTQVTIGGRTVPTKELYTPFKTTEGGTGYEFEGGQIQRAIEQLAPAEKFKETIKALAQEQLGLAPGQTPTQEQLRTLDPSTIKLLREADTTVKERQSALDRAEDFAALYKLRPEVTMGVTQKPVVSSITGEYLGTRSAVDRPGVYTPELYRMRASGGLGRQEVGSVGRRREMLASQEDYTPSGGSELEASTVLFKDPETGDVLTPNQVTEEMSQYLTPIRGTAVEPQRILGQQGRTYKGVGTQEIDPRSFDPVMLSQLAKQSPERVSPEGLIYGTKALGGISRANTLAEQQAARQAQDYAKSIQLGAKLAPKPLGGTESLPGIKEGEQLARATGAELMSATQTGTPEMQEAARNVLAAREERQKQTMSLKVSQELNRILKSGRPNATREARAYLKGLQEDFKA